MAYRAHRKGPGDTELHPTGFSQGRQFWNGTELRGTTYQYAVNSVREYQVEGARSGLVSSAVPSPASR